MNSILFFISAHVFSRYYSPWPSLVLYAQLTIFNTAAIQIRTSNVSKREQTLGFSILLYVYVAKEKLISIYMSFI